jgi:hypothetical protein
VLASVTLASSGLRRCTNSTCTPPGRRRGGKAYMGWERRNVGDSRRRTFIMLLAPHVLIMLCRCQIMTKYACSPGGNDRRYLNCPMQERTPYRICLGQLWAHSSPRIAIANPVGRRGSGSVACGVMSLTFASLTSDPCQRVARQSHWS